MSLSLFVKTPSPTLVLVLGVFHIWLVCRIIPPLYLTVLMPLGFCQSFVSQFLSARSFENSSSYRLQILVSAIGRYRFIFRQDPNNFKGWRCVCQKIYKQGYITMQTTFYIYIIPYVAVCRKICKFNSACYGILFVMIPYYIVYR